MKYPNESFVAIRLSFTCPWTNYSMLELRSFEFAILLANIQAVPGKMWRCPQEATYVLQLTQIWGICVVYVTFTFTYTYTYTYNIRVHVHIRLQMNKPIHTCMTGNGSSIKSCCAWWLLCLKTQIYHLAAKPSVVDVHVSNGRYLYTIHTRHSKRGKHEYESVART